MGSAGSGDIWITLQTHKNVMAIASLKDLAAVILVKGFNPDPDMAEQSDEESIPVLGTSEDTFTINGRLYNLLKQ
jgi:predicted transcriptional regulator